MDNTKNEFKASSVDAAIDAGLNELNLKKEEADIEIISNGGLFKKAVVAIQKKEKEEKNKENKKEEKEEKIKKEEKPIENKKKENGGKEFIENVLNLMKVSCRVEEKQKNKELSFYLKGEDASRIIGYRGETLDALQHIVSTKINKDGKKFDRIIVDADFYRQRREQTLTNLAKKLARQAYSTTSEVELEPMNSFERRIIHFALQDNNMAKTRSEGEGSDRHVVNFPKNKEESIEYGNTDFKKTGPLKTKKFGYPKKRF